MADGEGRLGRWSRLKQKGGVDDREQRDVETTRAVEKKAIAEAEPEAFKLPGGVRVRHFVPAMAPLAPEPEDDDDRLTRGIGHVEEVDENGEPDIQALKGGPDDSVLDEEALNSEDDLYDGIEDEDLTDEQKEVVSTLPPLESLNGDSDFTPFMREGVPEFIKRKAMRILWRANPLFAFRDGLNDYDEDFNVVHYIIDQSVGAYQVGRGHLTEEELQNMMPEKAKRAFDEDEEDVDEDDKDLVSDEEQPEEIDPEKDAEVAEQANEASAADADMDQTPLEQSELSEPGDTGDDTDIDDTDDLIH